MNDSLISVIVPIYNSSKTLDRCIRSIISQTYSNIEIILVNDGSKDNSLDICNYYKKIDNRIVVINKENNGVSSSRNEGLKKSHGDYVGFVDSDDYISSDMYAKLYENLIQTGSDISVCNYTIIKNDIIKNNKYKDKKQFNGIKECLSALIEKEIGWSNWNKLYSKRIISDILFDEKISVGEDGIFNLDIITSNKKVKLSFIDDYLYHYYYDDNSKKYENKINDYLYFNEYIVNVLNKYKIDSNFFKLSYIDFFVNSSIELIKDYKTKKSIFVTYCNELLRNKIGIKNKLKLYLNIIKYKRAKKEII